MKRKKRERMLAILMLLGIEMGLASLVGGAIAVVVVPLAYHSRGHFTMGGEWLVIYLSVMYAYHCIHARVFRKPRKRQKGGRDAGGQTARGAVRRRGNPAVDVGRCA